MTHAEVAVEPVRPPAVPARRAARVRRGPMRPARLVSVRTRRSRRLSSSLFRSCDAAALAVVAIVVTSPSADPVSDVSQWGPIAPGIAGVFVLCALLRSLGTYAFPADEVLARHLLTVLAALATAAATVLVSGRLGTRADAAALTALWTAVTVPVTIALHALWWTRVRGWRTRGLLTPNIAVVGAAHAEALIREALERRHVNVLGVFDERCELGPTDVLGVPVLGDVDALLAHRITPYLDRIVVAAAPGEVSRVRDITRRLGVLPNDLRVIVTGAAGAGRCRSAGRRLDTSPLPDPGRLTERARRAIAKRRLDLFVGVAMLVVFGPVLAVVAALIRLDSPGPVFFRQRRSGFNGEQIVVWKFRTMHARCADASARQQVVAGDERVTRVGRLLRRTGLDELPQLVNVVTGQMSLVGPRPHAVGMRTGDVESADLVADYARRYRLKPGLTGWAAVNGSRGPLDTPEDVARRVALDLDYIDNQSTLLDLRILVRTVPTLLGDRDVVR